MGVAVMRAPAVVFDRLRRQPRVAAMSEGSFNGILFGKQASAGSYSVASDCTGAFQIVVPPNPPCCAGFTLHYDFVMVEDGRQLTLFQRDPNTVSAGTAVKQFGSGD